MTQVGNGRVPGLMGLVKDLGQRLSGKGPGLHHLPLVKSMPKFVSLKGTIDKFSESSLTTLDLLSLLGMLKS